MISHRNEGKYHYMNFKDLQLSPLLLKALEEKGYVSPSPIQEKAIPHVLTGRTCWAVPRPAPEKQPHLRFPLYKFL